MMIETLSTTKQLLLINLNALVRDGWTVFEAADDSYYLRKSKLSSLSIEHIGTVSIENIEGRVANDS